MEKCHTALLIQLVVPRYKHAQVHGFYVQLASTETGIIPV